MKTKMILTAITLAASWLNAAPPVAGKDSSEGKYSNIGLKLSVGLGSQDVSSSQNLEKGDAASLSLGYGVSQRVTLWLGINSGKHTHELNPLVESSFAGLELNLQYKLRPNKRLRPYGTIGIGTFFLGNKETDIAQNGGGVTWALGAEYWLVRFLSVGAEFFWKDFEYTQERVGEKGDFTKIERPVSGDTNGFMIKFTLH